MKWSMPGLPVHHWLLAFTQTHVHWSVMPSNHLILCHPFSSCLKSFPAWASFQMSQLFPSGGQSIGASASVSVLPMSIQGWFPLRLTGLISVLSKGLSSVFSNTTAWKHQFLGAQPSLWSCLTSVQDYWKDHSLDHTDLGKVMSLPFNTLSRLVMAFLPRSDHLPISWLQSPSAVVLEPTKRDSVTTSTF